MSTLLPPLPLLFLRLSIASCFAAFGVWEIVGPNLWTAYVPPAVAALVDPVTLVFIHGIVLVVTAVGLLSGWRPRLWSGVAVAVLLELCITIWLDEGLSDVLIRDVALLLAAASLFAQSMERKPLQ